MWWLLLLPLLSMAQDGADFSDLDELMESDIVEANPLPEKVLPEITPQIDSLEIVESQSNVSPRGHRPPQGPISMTAILASGTEMGAVKEGRNIVRIATNETYKITKSFYGRFYRLPDEHGFKYFKNKSGNTTFKISEDAVESIEPILSLYEPPLRYTPAPENILRTEYDRQLRLLPEFSFYAGIVQSDYMKDLFNDSSASRGSTTQYGIHVTTDWDLPVKAGAVLHYERSHYKLGGGGQVNYSSLSLGPQFKSRDFDFLDGALRFQTQFRVSPFAQASAETQYGDIDFKFNSADLLFSAEIPFKNKIGEFVLGVFFQNQWLNLKDQSEIVSLRASNQTNKTFGLSFSQVIQ